MSGRGKSQQVSLLRPDPEALLHLARENLALLTEISSHYELARLGPPAEPRTFTRPEDVASYLAPELVDLAQEQFRVLLLDVKGQLLGTALVYQGGTNNIPIRLADCFREAVRAGAASVIFCHNHPSGDPTPSQEDVSITRLAIQAGTLLGIAVLDHIVVGKRGHVSLRQASLLPDLPVTSDLTAK